MSDVIVIFSHFGYSTYLDYTLKCARATNPRARLIFLGDYANMNIARDCGWEHHLFGGRPSRHRQRFDGVFRHLRGRNAKYYKNDGDWLRYIFERWFFIEEFISDNAIKRFWHFDSDTMILQDLSPYDKELENIDFSVQCNGACLNGVVSADVVGEYCQYICDLFEDEEFLKNKEKMLELEEHSFGFFSEMEAFERYKDKTSRPWKHLLNFSQLKAFDDCICQEHGFQMMDLSPERKIKQLFTGDGKIYGKRNDDLVEFVTLNLSWVPDSVFQWVFSQVVTEKN